MKYATTTQLWLVPSLHLSWYLLSLVRLTVLDHLHLHLEDVLAPDGVPLVNVDDTPEEEIIKKCKKKCEERLKCCNVCTKVAHGNNIWSCSLYYGKFGGLADLTIEEASYIPDVDEICAFKNTDRFCLAWVVSNQDSVPAKNRRTVFKFDYGGKLIKIYKKKYFE